MSVTFRSYHSRKVNTRHDVNTASILFLSVTYAGGPRYTNIPIRIPYLHISTQTILSGKSRTFQASCNVLYNSFQAFFQANSQCISYHNHEKNDAKAQSRSMQRGGIHIRVAPTILISYAPIQSSLQQHLRPPYPDAGSQKRKHS